MRLKELRIYGFKSFPNKTVLELSPGMTALVGPNGCGKSNVLDSIRWVLGEQTLSKLRCARNEDLVFAGSSRLPSLGYADVSLTVENQGDFPNLPAEVEIRRRYYSTGESGFWINREECRLKEIEDILRGGAAGGRLYSVFDAAKLASIVGGELNNLLESAAGVLGFRQKRKESERKLELVRRDLVRLEDIIGERKRIVRNLARQRRRAELYKELRERLVSLEARKMQARLGRIHEEIESKSAVISGEEQAERKLLMDGEGIRKELKENDAELTRILGLEREARAALDQVQTKLSEIVSSLSSSRTRKEAVEEKLARAAEERSQAETRLAEIAAETQEISKVKAEAEGRRKEAEETLAQARSKLSSDEEKLANLRFEVRELREQLKKLSTELSHHIESRTRELSLAENSASLAGVAGEELSKLAERSEALQAQISETVKNLEEAAVNLERFDKAISEKEKILAGVNETIRESERRRQEEIEQLSKITGQLASLRDKLEGQPKRELRRRLGERFRGLMEEFLTYPSELEAALEAVLYDILGFAAASGMPDLAGLALEGQAGLVLDRDIHSAALKRPSDPRFRLWISDKVSLKPQAPSLLGSRLKGWVLVDIGDLLELSRQYPELSFVSGEGAALRSDGILILGRPRGILADRRTLKELESQAKELERSVSSLEAVLERSRKEREQAERELDGAKQTYLEERSRKQSLESDRERLENQVSEFERERSRLRHEVHTREEEEAKAREKLDGLQEKIAALTSERSSKEERLSEQEKTLSDEEESLRDKLAGLNELLLALGKEEEAEHMATERVKRLEGERDKLNEIRALRTGEEDELRGQILELSRSIEHLEAERLKYEELRTAEQERLSGIDTSRFMEAKHIKEEELARSEEKLKNLREELIQHRTDLLLLKRQAEELEPLVSTAPLEEESLEPEEVESRLEATRRRIEDLGPVNEYAAVQYDEEKAELDRLSAQYADVTGAAENLTTIIREIDEEARSRFDVTFKAVREEFRRTFNFFFPGGESDLKLENLDDPFNSAINITARPEGKQLKRLSQLSDGERTMLGISLLFAFYAVRPAPFLFIDELDAPLDDNNVLKFASYLAHIKNRIQVFVITHNKRTMEKADTIYGVTMEEPGVSKIISVKLKEVKRQHVALEEA